MKDGTIITYAQYNEDIILKALLYDVKKGFYVDVGANDPDDDSVTKLFYQNGWNGINIEPIESLHKELIRSRPKDINLQLAIGDKIGRQKIREYINIKGHSTLSRMRIEEKGENQEYKDYDVEVSTLATIFKRHKVKQINFIKIDVEGFEGKVIAGNDWELYRPEIVCIEANHITEPWKGALLSSHYKLFIIDGLNEYYIAKESWSRTEGFEERAVKIQANSLRPYFYNERKGKDKSIKHLQEVLNDKNVQILQLQNTVEQLKIDNSLTLKNRRLLSRIKRSIYGLTIDWINFKKNTKS